MTRWVPRIAALVPAIWMSAAAAFGLGEISVQSRLNQGFSASVPLVSVDAKDAGKLVVRVADPAAYLQAGVERADYLSTLRFAVKSDGGLHIQISSSQPAKEPFLTLLLYVSDGSNRIVREYTVFLDPPDYSAPVSAPTPAPMSQPAPAPVAVEPTPNPESAASTAPVEAKAPAPAAKPEAKPAAPAPTATTSSPSEAPVAAAPAPSDSAIGPVVIRFGTAQKSSPAVKPAPAPEESPDVPAQETSVASEAPSSTQFYETAQEQQASGPQAADSAMTPVAAPVTPVHAEKPATVAASAPADTASTSGTGAASGDQYGPVAPGETLWHIATQVVPPGVTMNQMLLALYRANPQSFDGGINGVMKGAMLTVPSLAEIQKTAPIEAKAEVERLRGVGQQNPVAKTTATPSPAVAEPAAVAPDAPEPRTAPVEKVPDVEAPAENAAEATPATSEAAASSAEPAAAAETSSPEAAGEGVSASATEGAAETETASASGAAETSAEAEAPTEAASEPAAMPEGETPPAEKAAPAPKAPHEQPGLLETMLVPLAGGLVVLLGLGFLIARAVARKRAAKKAAPAARKKPEVKKTKVASELAAESAVAAKVEDDKVKTAANESEGMVPAAPEPEPEPESPKVPELAAEPDEDSEEPVDFDVTGELESESGKMADEANDPVSEADFHLAYGLYDDAAALLHQAATKEPDRTDIRLKLAETYFAAGKPAEFEQCARDAKGILSAAEWQKVEAMGQQLCPDRDLFKSSTTAPERASPEAEPAAEPEAPTLSAFDEPEAVEPSAEAASQDAGGAGLEFNLDDLDLGASSTAAEAAEPAVPDVDRGTSLDFDPSQFDLSSDDAAKPEPESSAAGAEAAAENALDFNLDLSGFDVDAADGNAAAPGAETASESSSAVEPDRGADIQLDDIDLDAMSAGGDAAPGEEVGTKLDLARAYVDMGDHEMARSLLEEVAKQGDAKQQEEARALLGRLG